jgi:hypothetical protein
MAEPTENAAGNSNLKIQEMMLKDRRVHFCNMLRHYAIDRFKNISGMTDLTIEDHPKPDAFVYGAYQAMIIVSGNDLRIAYRAHFNFKDVKPLFKAITNSEEVTPKAKRLVVDIFREYTNLAAGAIKQELETLGIRAGISLPIFTSGYDEIVSSDLLKPRRNYDYFLIKNDNMKFTGTIWFDVLEDDLISNYTFTAPEASDGDVDFL